jgi:hypothetical protein
MASLRLVAYVPAPGTGTREKVQALLTRDAVTEAALEVV